MKKQPATSSVLLFLLAIVLLSSSNGGAFTLTDTEGNEIQFESPFRRIISLYPAHTENLIALGLDHELIGITSADSQVINGKQVFSYHDDPEKFIAARPDLVLIRPMISRGYPQLIAHLEQMGIVVVSLQPRGVDEMFSYWRDLAELTGHQTEAEKLIAQFSEKLRHIAETVKKIPASKRPQVYFEAIHAKMKTFAPASIAIYCLEQAGGINVAPDAVARHDSNIAQYGKERILQKSQDIDVYLAQRGKMNPISLSMLVEEPGFQAIKAIKNGRYALIDEKFVSRPTPKLLEGIKQIHHILYPSETHPD